MLHRRPVASAQHAPRRPPTYGVHVRNRSQGRGGAWATLLKSARERLGWTQEDLANRAGVSRWTIMRWEQGSQEGRPDHLRKVADALGIPAADAFRAIGWLDPSPTPPPEPVPATYEERKKLLFEVLHPEDRAMVAEVLELAEAWMEKRQRERREAERSTGA